MSHSAVEIYLHVIFSTKGRLPLISENLENRLYACLGVISKENKCPILKINGTHDHLHLLVKLHSTVAISVLIKELKSHSSGWLKKQGVDDFSWQEGYGAFSCSVTHLDPLKKYIDNQKEHHKTNTLALVYKLA